MPSSLDRKGRITQLSADKLRKVVILPELVKSELWELESFAKKAPSGEGKSNLENLLDGLVKSHPELSYGCCGDADILGRA